MIAPPDQATTYERAHVDVPPYRHTTTLPHTTLAEARERVVNALGLEGFGVISELDLRDLLERRVGKDIGPYLLLSVCHASLAEQVLAIERGLGLFLPCKIALWEDRDLSAVVAVLRPDLTSAAAENPSLVPLAREADERLQNVLARLVRGR